MALDLLKYFPVPQFINPNCLGISYSDFSLKVVLFGNAFEKFPVETLSMPLEKGLVVDGVIANKSDFINTLKEVKSHFKTNFVRLTIPDELVYIFKNSLPYSERDMRESVAATIEENVPLSLEETVFDFYPLGIKKDGDLNSVEVVVDACLKSGIEEILNIFREAGFEVLVCLPESQAVANSVLSKEVKGIVPIVHVRESRIAIYLTKNGIVIFSTLRIVSGDRYKEDFLDEYSKFLEYMSHYVESHEVEVKNIFVCGDFEYSKQIVSAINESDDKIGKAVLANVWNNVFDIEKHTPELAYEESLRFAGAVGILTKDF